MKAIPHIACLAAAIALTGAGRAEIVIPVDAGETWQGYMNVFNLANDGGSYVFGSPWGTADLRAVFSGSTLTFSPNTIGDPAAFWYIGGGGPGAPGNKIMEANLYVQKSDGSLSGQTVTFSGTVTGNTLGNHDAVAFIKDFAPDYSSFNVRTVPLADGEFEVTLDTLPGTGRHVQYGFQMTGPNVWATDAAGAGSVGIAAIPVVQANPNVTPDPAAAWKGYVNTFNLKAPEGDGQWVPGVGGVWNTADLRASFLGPVLTLAPTMISPPDGLSDPFWYRQDGGGNKHLEANLYVEANPGSLTGLTVRFTGNVLSNTLDAKHTGVAFIKEFAADYSSVLREAVVPLSPGALDLSLAISNDPTTHVQYGFQIAGPNVWPDFATAAGSVQVASGAVDPYTLWIASSGLAQAPSTAQAADADPDGDGKNNLEEFALSDNPASGTPSGKVRGRVTTVDGNQAFVLTLPVRGTPAFGGQSAKSASVDGVRYTVEGSNGLSVFNASVTEVSPADTAGLPPAGVGANYRSFRLTDGAQARGFLRVRIEQAP